MSVIFATSAVLGFFREIVFASYFGTSSQMDALLVALTIPMFFMSMLGEATMGAAVVPVFVSFIAPQAEKEQKRIIGSAFMLLSLVLAVFTSIAVLAAPVIARVLAPGFDSSKVALTTNLMRIMLPSVFVLGLSNFVTGLLHAFRRFTAASATAVVFNLGLLLLTFSLANRIGVYAAAIGVLIGSVLQFLVMLPSLIETRLFPSVGRSLRDPAIVKMWWIFWPILWGALVVSGLQTVDKIVASFLPAGSIAALNYGEKIAGGPARIFAMAVSVVLFPVMAKKAHELATDQGATIVRGLNVAAFLTMPWAVLFIALRTPIVSVILQRGAFDAKATALVALPLAIYCLGTFANGISSMVSNAFYSYHDSKTPTYLIIGANVLRVVVILALVGSIGYGAIAIAQVICVNTALVVLLLALKRRHVPDLDLKHAAVGFSKILFASVVAGLVGWAIFGPISSVLPATQIGKAVALVADLVISTGVYFVAARLVACEEADMAIEAVRSRLHKGGRAKLT